MLVSLTQGPCHLPVFTFLQNLEKTPLEEVPAEPTELLDRERYQRSSRWGTPSGWWQLNTRSSSQQRALVNTACFPAAEDSGQC